MTKASAMNWRLVMLVVVAVAVPLGQASADHREADVVVCRDVRNGEPVGRVAVFTGTDPQVCIHVTLVEARRSHTVRWEFLRPNGSVYRTGQAKTDEAAAGYYYPRYRVWWCLSITGRELSFTPGEWSAKVTVDGRPLRTMAFQIIGVGVAEAEKAQARVQTLRGRVEANPKDAEARTELAEALVDLNQLDEAMVELRQAVELDPKLARAHGLMGFIFYRQGRWDDAERSLIEALRLRDDSARYHFLLARVYLEKGDTAKAIEQFRRVVRIAGDTSLGKEAQEELAKLGVSP